MILAVVVTVVLEVFEMFDHTFCSDQDGDGRSFDIGFDVDADGHDNTITFKRIFLNIVAFTHEMVMTCLMGTRGASRSL